MTNKELNFETGIVDYKINGNTHVRFNPADAAFAERLYDSMKKLDDRQDEFQKRVDEIGEDGEKMFAYARERDAEMRTIIDELLGEGVADSLFPDMNCYALADGMPVWVNLMFAIAEEVRDSFATEQKRADPRLRQYSEKNQELLEKYRKATTKR